MDAQATRRSANLKLALTLLPLEAMQSLTQAQASLLQYPVQTLNNRYYLIRAGQSEAESFGYVLTNPVSKTSMSSGLSSTGKHDIVKKTFPALKQVGLLDGNFWLWPSMTLNAYQTAEILASLYSIGRNKIVPEFSKLDPRGCGDLEGGNVDKVKEFIQHGDSMAADWRPPPGSTGTPNESSLDVMIRGRELLSLLETQYFGDTVLIISPDSDNLSILQAAVLGVDLTGHHAYEFSPGEVRQLQLDLHSERDDSPIQFACPRPPLCK